jgi:hypothetical protein
LFDYCEVEIHAGLDRISANVKSLSNPRSEIIDFVVNSHEGLETILSSVINLLKPDKLMADCNDHIQASRDWMSNHPRSFVEA